MKNFIKKEKLFLLIFGLSVIIFLWDVILLRKIFLYGDYKQQFFPWFMEYAKAVKHFTLPYWVPNMACGFPLVAEGQIGAFYPLNLIMFFLLPPIAAYSLGTALHFMLAGIFMYLFCKRIGLKDLSAIMPAILFMFASPYAGCFSNIASLKVLCWFPLVLFLISLSLEKGRPRILIFAGIIMGIQLLAGAVQMAFYSIAVSASYFIFCIFSAKRGRKIPYVVNFFAGSIIALIICSPQIMATQTLVGLSNRSFRGFDFAVAGSFFPAGILTLIFPSTASLFGGMMYIGILPLTFAITAMFYVKGNRNATFFLALFLISLFCALGRYNPLYAAFLKTSGFYLFRIPSKFLFFSAFSLIVLSGFGLQNLLTALSEERRKMFNTVSLTIFFASMSSLILAGIFLRAFKDQIIAFVKSYIADKFYNPALHRHPLQYYMERVDGLYQNALGILTPLDRNVCTQSFILVLSIALCILYAKKFIRQSIFGKLVVPVIFIDLLFFSTIGWGFRGNILKLSDAIVTTDEVRYIKSDNGLFRIYEFLVEGSGDALQPNLNVYFGIDNIGVYSPLVFKRYVELVGDLGCVDDSMGNSQTSEDILCRNLKLLSMLNVKYIISQKEIKGEGLRFLKDFQSSKKVYLNEKTLPRAFIVHKVKNVRSGNEALRFIKNEKFNPGETAVVEGGAYGLPIFTHDGISTSEACVDRYDNGKVSIRTKTDADGLLVLSDYFYPGWKGYLDGHPVAILIANYALRAVYLPKGEHVVEFKFLQPIYSRKKI